MGSNRESIRLGEYPPRGLGAGIVLALLLATAAGAAGADGGELAGIVIEKLPAHTALAAAGVEVGDRAVAWSRGAAAGGPLRSPFDWYRMTAEQTPRGAVDLDVVRRGESRTAVSVPGSGMPRYAPPSRASGLQTISTDSI